MSINISAETQHCNADIRLATYSTFLRMLSHRLSIEMASHRYLRQWSVEKSQGYKYISPGERTMSLVPLEMLALRELAVAKLAVQIDDTRPARHRGILPTYLP
jgi:hypothetical protein